MHSLRDELSAIVTAGVFGKNVNFVSFEENINDDKMYQYMSTVVFGTITTSDESAYHIVIKLKLRNEKLRKYFKIDFQFHNEITMYEKIIPFLLSSHSSTSRDVCNIPYIPRFFYGRNRCGEFVENDLVVLENISPQGYRLCEERIFLDYDHLISALQALAKFHALSYAAKHKDPAGFREAVAGLRDAQLHPDVLWLFEGDTLRRYGERGVDRLSERGDGRPYRDNGRLRRFRELIADGENSVRRALRPREPLSVVCHGDANRNNVLFRYDGGRPAAAALLDFGMARYGSPALDLSFLLYANAAQATRRARWHDLLDAYCATVAASVPPGVRAPGRAELDAEMAAGALFGLAHALFSVPFQMAGGRSGRAADGPRGGYRRYGGDAETERVADAVQHFVDMAYTDGV